MSLVQAINVSLDFGSDPIFDEINFNIKKGQKLCLIGRNGEGKSTLLKLLNGDITLEHGEIRKSGNVQIGMMEQQVPENENQLTVFEMVSLALGDIGQTLIDYHKELIEPTDRFDDLQAKITDTDSWDLIHRIETILSQLKLNEDDKFSDLSGGLKRKVVLARALVKNPDILLLDEPTNHLDIEAIEWLEKFVLNLKIAVLFITHDRSFLKNVAQGIFELDRGKVYYYDCDYENFLIRKEQRLNAEDLENKRFDKKLAQEEVWIRQGIKARRTRNEGRVRELKKMREERSTRRNISGTSNAEINIAEKSGKKVITAHKIGFQYKDNVLFENFSAKIRRGDKIGIVGKNGVGKTTLIKVLLEELEPTSGSIKHGTGLEVAYFDQLKSHLNLEDTVANNLNIGSDEVMVNGKPVHVISYLQKFLFSPKKIMSPAKVLSGGERSRLLLARLFARPANLLVLDEPTNDLDIETLDLLQSLLFDFPGTVLLISHDRDFIDNVATQTYVFEGNGKIQEYVGGYEDYMRQRFVPVDVKETKAKKDKPKSSKINQDTHSIEKKLSFKEQYELKNLPEEIDQLENEIKELSIIINDPEFYQEKEHVIKKANQKLKELNDALQIKFSRWDELEG